MLTLDPFAAAGPCPAGSSIVMRPQGTAPAVPLHEPRSRHRHRAPASPAPPACGPFLPPLLAGALARGDVGIDFDGTDWSFLESPGVPGRGAGARPWSPTCVERSAATRRAGHGRCGPPPLAMLAARSCSARCCSPARSPTAATTSLARARRRARSAPRSAGLAVGGLLERARRAPRRRRPRRSLIVYADGGRARPGGRSPIFVPPARRSWRSPGFARPAARRPPPRGREVRRACASCGSRAASRRSSSSRSSTR